MLSIVSNRTALAVAALLAAAACSGRTGNESGRGASAPAARPAVAVALTPAVAADIVDAIDVVGSLAPKFAADVKSEVSGTVAAVYVNEWVPVRRGAWLARIDPSETEAGIEALTAVEAQARVAEARARRERERAEQLKQYGLITSQALDEAESALDASRAGVVAAAAQVGTARARLAKYSIRAPMDGVVAQRNVSVGDRVENMGGGNAMFRIVDNRLLNLTVTVPSSRLPAVRVGQRLEFTTDTAPGRVFAGRVMFINPAIDEASRSAKLVAEVPNADGALAGGLFVRGRIVVAVRPGIVRVPRAALLNWNVSAHSAEVFTIRDGHAAKRTVTTGAAIDDAVEIVNGVAAGDAVITRGGFALRPGDPVTVAGGEGA